jgi:hypothetical protein
MPHDPARELWHPWHMTHLRLIDPAAATGALHEVYARMQARPMPPAYRPTHGGVAGIIRAHSLDAELMPLVFGVSSQLNGQGPLTWPQRELVNAITSRLNQCFY